MNDIAFSILLVLIGIIVGVIIIIIFNYIKGNLASKKAEILLDKTKKEAEKIKKEQILEAKEESYKIKKETEQLVKEKKDEVKEMEERLLARESSMDRRDQTLQNREQMLEAKENNLINRQKDIQAEQEKVEQIKKEQIELLENIAGFSKSQAKDMVMKKVEDMMGLEIAAYIKDCEATAKLEADKISKNMLVSSMQRYAGDVANDQTVTVEIGRAHV